MISFRKATKKDVPIILKWWNDGNVMKDVGFPQGLDLTHDEVVQSIKGYQEQAQANFFVILDEDKKVIGEFCFKVIREKVATFDIKVGEINNQGKGYGRQSVLQGIEYIKRIETINLIEIEVSPENSRAISLYQSIGFHEVKRLPNHWKDGLGNLRDTIVYQLEIKR